jgi:prevent-host-death family protein
MESIGAFEAKTHLSSLLDRAERGERITITKRGRPVAMLVPVEHRGTAAPSHVVSAMRAAASRRPPLGTDWRTLVEDGRRM